MGNFSSIATGLAAHDEEEAEEVMSVVSEGQRGTGEEEQREEEVMSVVSEGARGVSQEEQQQEGGDSEAEDEVEVEKQAEPERQCSICLDVLVLGGEERSTARLQCGHKFHLDCIGSAFNAKGTMECPNCRMIQTGHWRYANGPRSSPDANDDWVLDEDLDPAPDVFVPLRFRWLPIDRLSELPSLDEEIDPSAAATFLDEMGQNFSADEPMDPPEPSTTPLGSYLAYLQPLPQPASSSNSLTIPTVVDSSADRDHWNYLVGLSEDQPLPTVPRSYSPSNNNNVLAEQPGLPVEPISIGGVDSDSQHRGSLPPFFGNWSGRTRIPSVPPQAPEIVREPQLQQASSSLFAGPEPGVMRPFGADILLPDRTLTLLLDDYLASSSVENNVDDDDNPFYNWEPEHFFPHLPFNNEEAGPSSSQQQPSRGALEPPPVLRMEFGNWAGSASAWPPPPPDNVSSDDASL